ncbi:MAG: hypothetical protein HY332_21690 [Chloroflexi bacterium]|nr:hypothetical protein [Chloroflexota bacterium]
MEQRGSQAAVGATRGGDLRIERIEVFPVSVPRRATWMLQRGRTGAASIFTIVKLTTTEGVVGWGEAVTLVRPFDRIIRDHLVALAVGRSPFDLVGLHGAMDRVEMLANERVGSWNPGRAADR